MAAFSQVTTTATVTLWCLLLGTIVNLTIVTSATTPRCRQLMMSLTCPANRKLQQIQAALASISMRFENLTENLERRESSASTAFLPELHQLQTQILNITSNINETRGINEDFQSILRKIVSPEIDISSERSEVFQVAIVCLWLELQGLMRNVTSFSTAQSTSQLTNNVRWSDMAMQISYLQQHMESTNQNVSFALARVASMEQHMTSLRECVNAVNKTRLTLLSNHLNLNQTGGVLKEELMVLKATIAKNGGKMDNFQSALRNKHLNALPQYEKVHDPEVSRKILDALVKTDDHLVNVTMATVLMEHEVMALRVNVEERLGKVEEDVRNIREMLSQGRKSTAERPMASVTASTCDGPRRHLVGNSCYYIPLLKETETQIDTNPTWWDARYLCRQPEVLGRDADLVAIESYEEMEALRRLIDNHFGGIEEFWIGGNDLDTEGSWRWSMTSDPIGFSNWGRAPSSSLGRNCMSMLRGFKWAAEPCFYRRRAICELRLA